MILNYTKSFIEEQFPEQLLGYECLKERKAGASQTLTGLGKWWGRKPLILVRATILGLLMPASDNPTKDMDIFLKILTMDDDGLWLRNKNKKKFTREEFDSMSYNDKLTYCIRPEHVENLPADSWLVINKHLKTNASNLQELINELGQKKFGHTPKVGDVFCGGGSIPFEAARIGCETHASDLNPVATMLTWASLNLLSKSDKEIEELKKFQDTVYDAVKKKVDELGIEKNENNEVADYYLYCNEAKCPHCNAEVPLSPSWIISAKSKTIAKLIPNGKKYLINIINDASEEDFKNAKNGTVVKGKLVCPSCHEITPISTLRGDKKTENGTQYGLRMWTNEDIVPRDSDVFKERLYCIRYVDSNSNKKYVTPTKEDFKREENVLLYVKKHFKDWQDKGYIPSDKIIEGAKTSEPIRTRGWTHWHHLFNPRQLLIHALFANYIEEKSNCTEQKVIGLLGINNLSNKNCKLNYWQSTRDNGSSVFYNQALNTVYTTSTRALSTIDSVFKFSLTNSSFNKKYKIILQDARGIDIQNDMWITDPPYADAVDYHELTEFFLAWDKKMIPKIFPEWYADSKRELAVRGADQSFVDSMIDVYSNLTNHMTDNGMQVVMFNHNSNTVLEDFKNILTSSGLEIVNTYSIDIENTSNGLKKNKNHYSDVKIYICKKK